MSTLSRVASPETPNTTDPLTHRCSLRCGASRLEEDQGVIYSLIYHPGECRYLCTLIPDREKREGGVTTGALIYPKERKSEGRESKSVLVRTWQWGSGASDCTKDSFTDRDFEHQGGKRGKSSYLDRREGITGKRTGFRQEKKKERNAS